MIQRKSVQIFSRGTFCTVFVKIIVHACQRKSSLCAAAKGSANGDLHSVGQHKLIFTHRRNVFVVDPIALVAANKSTLRHVFQQFSRGRSHHFCAITHTNPCLVQDPFQIKDISKQNTFDC